MLVDLARRRHGVPVAVLAEEGDGSEGNGETQREWRGVGLLLELGHATWSLRQSLRATRRDTPVPVGHDEFCLISETAESTPDDTTNSVLLMIYNSQTVAIWFMV